MGVARNKDDKIIYICIDGAVDPLRDVFHDSVHEDDEQCAALWHAFFQSFLPASVPLILHSSLLVRY